MPVPVRFEPGTITHASGMTMRASIESITLHARHNFVAMNVKFLLAIPLGRSTNKEAIDGVGNTTIDKFRICFRGLLETRPRRSTFSESTKSSNKGSLK